MTPTHLDLDRIEGLAGRLRADAAHTGHDSDWFVEHCLRVNSAASDLTAMITRIRELEAALQNVASTYAAEDYRDGSQERRLGDLARTALQRKTP